MAAHMREIMTQMCIWDLGTGCERLATHEVFNTWNAKMGNYCAAHANLRVQQLNEAETPVVYMQARSPHAYMPPRWKD